MMLRRACLAGLVAGATWAGPTFAATTPFTTMSPQSKAKAQQFYAQVCANCHGNKGLGDGPVAQPDIWQTIEGIDHARVPRDLVNGFYVKGDSLAQITATLRDGIPGTAMSGYKDLLSPREIEDLAHVVLALRKTTNAKAKRP